MPYNDPEVIAGQGTIGIELFEQAPDLDAVFVAVGGGGMISGIGAALRALDPNIDIIGCWPANAPTLKKSLEAGEIIEMEEGDTLSDGTAGGVEPGSITFPLCQSLITRTVLVSEEEIKAAMRNVASAERWIIVRERDNDHQITVVDLTGVAVQDAQISCCALACMEG